MRRPARLPATVTLLVMLWLATPVMTGCTRAEGTGAGVVPPTSSAVHDTDPPDTDPPDTGPVDTGSSDTDPPDTGSVETGEDEDEPPAATSPDTDSPVETSVPPMSGSDELEMEGDERSTDDDRNLAVVVLAAIGFSVLLLVAAWWMLRRDDIDDSAHPASLHDDWPDGQMVP